MQDLYHQPYDSDLEAMSPIGLKLCVRLCHAGLGFRGLGFRGLGFRVLTGLRGFGERVFKGFKGFRV